MLRAKSLDFSDSSMSVRVCVMCDVFAYVCVSGQVCVSTGALKFNATVEKYGLSYQGIHCRQVVYLFTNSVRPQQFF